MGVESTSFKNNLEEFSLHKNAKIYTKGSILLATYIGGPLAAGILISKNYKYLRNEESARWALYIGVIISVILFSSLVYLPERVFAAIPKLLIPLIYIGIVTFIVERLQGKQIKEFLASGGTKIPSWKAFGIGLICLVLTLLFVVALVMFQPPFEGKKMVFGNQKHEIYYVGNIDKSEISKLGKALIDCGLFTIDKRLAIQLVSDESENYKLYIPVPKSWWTDKDLIESLQYLESYLSDSLLTKPVKVIMLEETFTGREEKPVSEVMSN